MFVKLFAARLFFTFSCVLFGTTVVAACNPAMVDIGQPLVIERDKPSDDKCFEDEARVVAPDQDGQPDGNLRWVCVPLDDFLDEDSFNRLDAILATR